MSGHILMKLVTAAHYQILIMMTFLRS